MGTNVASLTQRWHFRNLITSPGPQCCSVDSGHVLRSQDNLALGWVMGRAAYTWTQAPDASPMTAVRPLRHRPGCTVLLGCPWQRGRLVKPPPTLEVAGVKNSNYIIKTVKQMPERTGNKRISKGQADTLSLLHEGQHIGGSPVYSPASTEPVSETDMSRAAPWGWRGTWRPLTWPLVSPVLSLARPAVPGARPVGAGSLSLPPPCGDRRSECQHATACLTPNDTLCITLQQGGTGLAFSNAWCL